MSNWQDTHPMGTVIGDPLPGAPALAARGGYATGVRTFTLVHPGQADVLAGLKGGRYPRYDRQLTIEAWYPAVPDGDSARAEYREVMGRSDWGNVAPFTFPGRAFRDARPDPAGGPWPVIVVSHGYPGSRMLLSNLSENLSGKGYVVLNIGHTDNTYEDFPLEGSLESGLIHRSFDQRFVIDQLPALNGAGWLKGMLDVERIGLMGFSLGGYGALRTLGARPGSEMLGGFAAIADELAEAPDYSGVKAVKAAVLFAPATFFLDESALDAVTQPTLWVCGTADRAVFYDRVHAFCEKAIRSERRFLSFENCGHNVANNPAPACAQSRDWTIAKRWADPVWDTWRLNNANCHFATAFFDLYLKGIEARREYLDMPVRRGIEAVWSVDAQGRPNPDHTYWPGFVEGGAAGLAMERFEPEGT